MPIRHRKYHRISYFASSLSTVLGLVLIWRGLWYLLDFVDQQMFGNNHELTAIIGVIVGFLILYLPDHQLDEIRKL